MNTGVLRLFIFQDIKRPTRSQISYATEMLHPYKQEGSVDYIIIRSHTVYHRRKINARDEYAKTPRAQSISCVRGVYKSISASYAWVIWALLSDGTDDVSS